jgi:hypothetical protein
MELLVKFDITTKPAKARFAPAVTIVKIKKDNRPSFPERLICPFKTAVRRARDDIETMAH